MFFLFLEKYANEVVAPNAIEKMATAMIKKKKTFTNCCKYKLCVSAGRVVSILALKPQRAWVSNRDFL